MVKFNYFVFFISLEYIKYVVYVERGEGNFELFFNHIEPLIYNSRDNN